MRTSKAVGAVSLALGLLMGATHVMAGPVLTLASDGSFGNVQVSSGKFSDVYSTLHVDGGRTITAYLATQSNQALDIEGVYFVKLDEDGKPIESIRRAFKEVVSGDWLKQNYGSERWEFSSDLEAGDWQLQVKGEDLDGKYGRAYAGTIQTDNKVPEPQTLMLSLLALAVMAGVTVRRQIAR